MCVYCKDMKKYGGPGIKKQACKERPPCFKKPQDLEDEDEDEDADDSSADESNTNSNNKNPKKKKVKQTKSDATPPAATRNHCLT